MASDWREFERLVARIEAHLGPRGATIRSPDYIPDKITGQPRQVDASICYQVGSIPILITIECRDRVAGEDVRWIEELIAKRDSIGASATVAVSSSKFSKPALEKARALGIETRLLREISDEAIGNWAEHIEIVAVRGKFAMGQLRLRFKSPPDSPPPELHPDVKAEYEKGDVEYKFIRNIADGKLISIGDLLRQAEREAGNEVFGRIGRDITVNLPPKTSAKILISSQFPSLFDDVPINGEPVTKIRAWSFEPNEATVETTTGPVEIEYLDVELRVKQTAYPSEVGRLLSYSDDASAIVHVEEREFGLGNGDSIKIVISGKPGTEDEAL